MSGQSKLEQLLDARRQTLGETPARKRLALLFDPDTFVELDGFAAVEGAGSGVVCGYGSIAGSPACAFAQDSTEGGGAVGRVHAAKIARLLDLALKTGTPVVGLYDSNGARVSEGVDALGAYGDILGRINNLSGVVPQISLVLGTCVGSSAMLACSGDFLILSEEAEFYFEPPATGEKGSTAQAAFESGVAALTCPDQEAAIAAARELVALLPLNNLAPCPVGEFAEPPGNLRAFSDAMPGAAGLDVLEALADAQSLTELYGAFGLGAVVALGSLGGATCGFVATSGKALCPDSCAKIAKFVSICDAYQIPVVTLVDTPGLASGAQEPAAAVRSMARMAHVYAEATTPKVTVVTGQAYGAAYVALCSRNTGADYTVAWPSATLAPLPPQTAVAFLHGERITAEVSRAQVEAEYIEKEASARAAAEAGAIDDVIDPAVTRPAVLAALDLLSAKRVTRNPKKHANLPL